MFIDLPTLAKRQAMLGIVFIITSIKGMKFSLFLLQRSLFKVDNANHCETIYLSHPDNLKQLLLIRTI